MHKKRSFIRAVTRVLYAGGFVFLIAGLLLSALSTTVLASGPSPLDLAQAPTQLTPPNCNCTTPTPVGTKPAPTRTVGPGTPTRTPHVLSFNLSSICGYTFDNYELWRVGSKTNEAATYTWEVVGSSEHGSGHVAANGVDYFTTSAGQKTVRLFVDGQLMDSENCLAPCKQELTLSYACTSEGLEWVVHNTNTFGVDFTWKLDTGEKGSGTMGANSSKLVTTSSPGAHQLSLTWTDTRPGTHTVTLSSPANSCSTVPTVTHTAPPPPPSTETPTVTFTPQSPTETPTVTFTPPPVILTSTVTETPTVTQTSTQTSVVPTLTPTQTQVVDTLTPTVTSTVTLTSQPPAPTNTPTNTPTTTLTPQSQIINTPTVTPTATTTSTATKIVTLAPPAPTGTSTPVLIPVTGADLTRPIGANSLVLFGGLFTNIGLFTLGLALALTGISSQLKDR